MKRPEHYEWWIDSIQDCLCQIAERFDGINPRSGACRHVCEETSIDLSHFAHCVLSHEFVDVPTEPWVAILELSESDDLETPVAKMTANMVLETPYFRERRRWPYAD